VMIRPPAGLQRTSLPLLSIARAESKSRERICFNTSLPWQRNSWALRSVSTVALSSTRAQRFYHYGLPETYEFVKVRSCWAIVKELHPTFHSRKSGLFISRFCGLFIPLLTPSDQRALEELFVYANKHIAETQFASPFPEDIFMVAILQEMHM
jgi:hypothetical protein